MSSRDDRDNLAEARPRFLVVGVDPSTADHALSDDEAHHLARVLRLGPGAHIVVFDGRGHEWTARVTAVTRGRVTVTLGDERPAIVEPAVHVTLAIGLLKGDQMDAVVRDATMLGVAAIVPMSSAHVTLPERMWRGGKSIERWQRVAVASAKQCRRAVVPEIASITPFAAVVASGGTRLLCVEPSAERARPIGAMGPAPTHATVLIGPEGGWSQAEIAAAEEAGCRLIRLGPRTLRAESGPIVALSALWTCWGW